VVGWRMLYLAVVAVDDEADFGEDLRGEEEDVSE
jgi:hypothetical protein